MATKFVQRNADAAAAKTGSHAGIGVDSDDDQFYVNPAGTRKMVQLAYSATLAAASTLTAADSGSTFFLSAAAEFATTLPAPAQGLNFKFIVSAAPSGAAYTIASAGGTDNIHGMVVSSADAGGSADSTAGTAADLITFVDGQAAIGDRVDLVSDGTLWFAAAFCGDEDAITFTAS